MNEERERRSYGRGQSCEERAMIYGVWIKRGTAGQEYCMDQNPFVHIVLVTSFQIQKMTMYNK